MANERIGSALPFKGVGANYIEKIDTDGKQLTSADSGKTFMCHQNATADVGVNLPSISETIAGWNARFILAGASSNDFQILPYGGVLDGGATDEDDKMYVMRGPGPITGSATVDVASLADATGSALFDITVTGADLGDFAMAAPAVDPEGLIITANVRAANTVEVSVHNETAGTVNLASTTWKAGVWSNSIGGGSADLVKFNTEAGVGLSSIDMFCDGTNWWATIQGPGEAALGVG